MTDPRGTADGTRPSTPLGRQAIEEIERAADGALAIATLDGGVIDRSFLIAGLPVRFVFAGPALVDRLTRAMGHLPSCDDLEPALTVVAWDSASTGAPAPRLPIDDDPGGPEWRRMLVVEPPMHAIFKPGPGTFSVVDQSRPLAWYWCADADQVPIWEEGTPFLHVFHHWLSSRGMQLVHAGAAGDDAGGVLFVGRSGSGKSTATLASMVGGMGYAGDDYVVVTADPEPTVHALYSSGKLDESQLARFPELAAWVVNRDGPAEEKRVFFLAEHVPERAAISFPLRAVLCPRVTGRVDTELVPTSSAAALAALAPSTIFQMPGAAGPELAAIAALLRQVPAWTLEAGTDLTAVAPLARRLVADAPAGAGRDR